MLNPLALLVQPAQSWSALQDKPRLLPALLFQTALMLISFFIARRAYTELWEASGLASIAHSSSSAASWLSIAALPLLIAASNLLGALGLWAGLLLAGIRQRYASILIWFAYGLTPSFSGRFLGLLLFSIVQPLTTSPGKALEWQFSPSGLTLASFFAPLSYPWLLAASLDLFGLWSLALLAIGARRFLGLSVAATALAMTVLVLLWLLVLTGIWLGALDSVHQP